MLVLGLHLYDEVTITIPADAKPGDHIVVSLTKMLSLNPDSSKPNVHLGFVAPKNYPVNRAEIQKRIEHTP